MFHRTRVGGFWLYSCGFNRPAKVKLTPMGNAVSLTQQEFGELGLQQV
ncbi:MAG TPA: hypothetical protein V6C90_22680 [Coleofasciculaceae cyanobacterium]|jgi:hypothetical protein